MFTIKAKKTTETEVETKEAQDTRQPEFSRHDFGWESLASVEESRQNQLISEIYSIMNTGDDEKLEFIKREWSSLSEEGIDDALEARFNQAVHRYETRQERLEEAQNIKKQLILDAEALKDSSDWNKTSNALQELQKKWKEAGFAGEDIDQDLWEKFRGINDQFFDRRSSHYEKMSENRDEARTVKEALIVEVDALKDSEDWKQTSTDMRNLMTRWKQAGFAGREYEDELWERFNSARQFFYQKQREFFDSMRDTQSKAREIKEDVITRAEALVQAFHAETTREGMEALFEEWKAAGHSGRDHEEKLWNEFRAIQDDFYDRLKNRDVMQRQNREDEVSNDLETLEVRISALESINEKIAAKLSSLEGQLASNDSETLREEVAGLKANLEENEARLAEYQAEYAELDAELNKM
ncbi:DUF349 domain-containing protein [Erysipelothrix sp. HDW6C]|uniref:DUF349 domain-containing protein n=1 Tax=Erysipelothrix sp. HDW6C TaxID=2714930 RepID=UPI00140CDC1E|nr:DUF349 domain-containing protein [Erysipelothrix sp. HDW6C]QIK69748.1 DUF349 domain-containing protein [Erysipelothrix sp. HDW6C]